MRKVALGLALSGVIASQAHAVGLGEIRTHSALNQPLSANIELVETAPGDVDDIQVALAPSAVFEQVGISRSKLLDQLEFIPTIENGVATIKVVSLQPIQEPFLNFVLEVTWANGKLLREYTVLLDPPVFSDTQYAGVAAPVASEAPLEPAFTSDIAVEEPLAPAEVVTAMPVFTESMPLVTETEMLAVGAEPFVSVPDAVEVMPGVPISESEAFLYDGLQTYPVEDLAGLPEPVVLSEADIAAELNQPLPEGGFDPFVQAGALPDADLIGMDAISTPAPQYGDYPIEQTYALAEEPMPVAEAGIDQIFVAQSELTPAEAEIENIFSESPSAPAASVYRDTSAGDSYRVARGDTLSKIARQVGQPGALNKTMVALLRENPSAFINNNMNLVRAGYILRVPDPATINGISEREALSLIASQNAAWREYRSSVASVATPQLDSTGFAGIADLENRITGDLARTTVDTTTSTEPGVETVTSLESRDAGVADLIKAPSELTILVPDGKGDSIEGADTTGTGAIGNLESELSFAKEQLESQTQQNTELRSRVGELESLLESKNRLIELKNEQLADFQEKLTDAGVQVADVTRSVANEATELAGSAASAVQDTAKGLLPKSGVEQSTETSEKTLEAGSTTAVKEPAPVRKPAEVEEPGMLDALKDNPNLLMGAGFGGLLLAALGWLLLRRKNDETPEEEFVATGSAAAVAPAPVIKSEPLVAVPDVVEKAIDLDENELVNLDDVSDDSDSLEEELAGLEQEADLPADSGMAFSTDDEEDEVMSEANVYLAYGLQDQAIDLLKPVVASKPDRIDYAMKLAEAYHAAGDRQSFAELAGHLKGRVDPDSSEWKKLASWGVEMMPNDSLFQSAGTKVAGLAAAGVAMVGGIGSAAVEAGEKVADSLSVDDEDEFGELISEDDLSIGALGGADEVAEIDLSELDDFEVDLAEESSGPGETRFDLNAGDLSIDDGIDLEDITLDDQDEVLATSEIEDASLGLGPAATLAMDIDDDDLDLDTLVGDDESLNVFSTGEDEVSTKLDLAKAYLDMGDDEGAREALDEVISIGSEEQRNEAVKLKAQLDA